MYAPKRAPKPPQHDDANRELTEDATGRNGRSSPSGHRIEAGSSATVVRFRTDTGASGADRHRGNVEVHEVTLGELLGYGQRQRSDAPVMAAREDDKVFRLLHGAVLSKGGAKGAK